MISQPWTPPSSIAIKHPTKSAKSQFDRFERARKSPIKRSSSTNIVITIISSHRGEINMSRGASHHSNSDKITSNPPRPKLLLVKASVGVDSCLPFLPLALPKPKRKSIQGMTSLLGIRKGDRQSDPLTPRKSTGVAPEEVGGVQSVNQREKQPRVLSTSQAWRC